MSNPWLSLLPQLWFGTNFAWFVFADDDFPDAAAGVPVDRKIDPLDMTFLNHEAAFKSKSTMQVLRGYVVYQLCSIGFLVENNETVNALALKTLSTD